VLPEEQHEAVGKDSGQTNHIERFNNTLRQRLGCLVRKTLSFSKSMPGINYAFVYSCFGTIGSSRDLQSAGIIETN